MHVLASEHTKLLLVRINAPWPPSFSLSPCAVPVRHLHRHIPIRQSRALGCTAASALAPYPGPGESPSHGHPLKSTTIAHPSLRLRFSRVTSQVPRLVCVTRRPGGGPVPGPSPASLSHRPILHPEAHAAGPIISRRPILHSLLYAYWMYSVLYGAYVCTG